MGRACWAHVHLSRVPLEDHHVWPKADGGPNVPANRRLLCSNAHSAVHDLLDKMRKAGTEALPWQLRRGYGRKVRRLAVAGYRATLTRTIVDP